MNLCFLKGNLGLIVIVVGSVPIDRAVTNILVLRSLGCLYCPGTADGK